MIFDVIVCDEAHRISNPSTKLYKAINKVQTKKKFALTGTPISNNPLCLFGIISWLSPGYLGTYYQFAEKYCVFVQKHIIIGYRHLDDLAHRVEKLMLRRIKEEVLNDFPSKTVSDILIELSKKEREFYVGIQRGIAAEIEKMTINPRTLNLIPVKILRLKQATGHPALISDLQESSKLTTLKELLEPIMNSGGKAVIFTQFAKLAHLLCREFKNYQPRLICGDVPSEDRQRFVREFTKDENCKLIVSSDAGAYGLNLQVASYVVNYDLPWSVSKYFQRIDRVHRIGQKKPVTVYNLIVKNSIDEFCNKKLLSKGQLSNDVLKDSARLASTGLSEEDIKNILRI